MNKRVSSLQMQVYDSLDKTKRILTAHLMFSPMHPGPSPGVTASAAIGSRVYTQMYGFVLIRARIEHAKTHMC